MQSETREKSNFEDRPFYGAKLRKEVKSLAYDGILYSKSGVAVPSAAFTPTISSFETFQKFFLPAKIVY